MRSRWLLVTIAAALYSMSTAAKEHFPVPERSACFDSSAAKYNVNAELLRAMAEKESTFNNAAVGYNKARPGRSASKDMCVMQINSDWKGELARYGIKYDDVRFDPCLCIDTGAWVLRRCMAKYGDTLEAIQCYNSGRPIRGLPYATDVERRFIRRTGRPLSSMQNSQPRQHAPTRHVSLPRSAENQVGSPLRDDRPHEGAAREHVRPFVIVLSH
jgi:soluble lytic murein transglycosylase-like protein